MGLMSICDGRLFVKEHPMGNDGRRHYPLPGQHREGRNIHAFFLIRTWVETCDSQER